MLGRVSINNMKFGKRLEIQLVILASPGFRGQEFKGKRPLCKLWSCQVESQQTKGYSKTE